MVRVVIALLGLVAAVCAQESSYTGPMFNPSDAPFFGPSSLVIPTLTDNVPTFTQTPTFIRSRTSSAGSVSHSTHISSTASHSASHSSSVSASASRTPTPSQSASRSSTASASAPAQSTGAASANYPGVVGAIAGGVVAGLAWI